MNPTLKPTTQRVRTMNPLEKINDPDSQDEWSLRVRDEFMREVAREAARRMVQSLPDQAFSQLAGMVTLKSPPTTESIRALMPPEGTKKPQFITRIALEQDVTMMQARELLTAAVVRGALKEFKVGREIIIGLPAMDRTEFDWASVMKVGEEATGPYVLKEVMKLTGKAKPTVYKMIQDAVAAGIMESSRPGREQILVLPVDPLSEPDPVPLDNPDACPEQDFSGLLPPPKKSYPRNFAEHWWAGRAEWGRWDSYVSGQQISDRTVIWSKWRSEYYKD